MNNKKILCAKILRFFRILHSPVVWIPRAAPTTDRATDSAIPKQAHIYGEVVERNQATEILSP